MNFLEELEQLQLQTPRLSLIQLKNVNSDYTCATDQCKNCFLIANAVNNQDCLYGRDLYDNSDCVDCDHIAGCQLCYQCLNCKKCYNCDYLQDSANSYDCLYGYDLNGCSNCVGCVSLRHKEYYIFNQPYSKEAYFEKLKNLSQDEILQFFEELELKCPRLFAMQLGSENFTGDYVYFSKNAYECFDVVECQDVGYLVEAKKCQDSWDVTILEDSSLCYEIAGCHVLYNCNFCFMCSDSNDLEYCELVFNSQYCFGCVGLHHKRYHILNQPYEKEDYFKKITEIKAKLRETGEYARRFLPPVYPFENTVAVWPTL